MEPETGGSQLGVLTVPVACGGTKTYRVLSIKGGLAVLDCENHYSVTHVASGRVVGSALFIEKAIAFKVFEELSVTGNFPIDWEESREALLSDSWFIRRACPQIKKLVNSFSEQDAKLHPDRYEDEHADWAPFERRAAVAD